MVIISEWLPNPIGSDTKGEWVELHNDGVALVSLNGWRLTPDGKKFFTLHGSIAPGAYIAVPRSASKLSLKNTDGALALYDASGRLADHVAFQGSAPEGQSANRTSQGTASFAKPTPGAANPAEASAGIVHNEKHPYGVPLGPHSNAAATITGSLLGTALALAAAAVFILKAHEGLSHVLFGGDENAWSGDR